MEYWARVYTPPCLSSALLVCLFAVLDLFREATECILAREICLDSLVMDGGGDADDVAAIC